MSIRNRVTYLKGLAEGLNLGSDTKEEKLLRVVIEVLEEISVELQALAEEVESLDEDVNILVEDMQDLEDMYFDDDEEASESSACCALPPLANAKSGGSNDKKPQFYEVECPSCQSEITIDEDVLRGGSIECPNCGELLELEE